MNRRFFSFIAASFAAVLALSAPLAAHAADDKHRERDEGEAEVEGVGRDDADGMGVKRAAHAHDRA